MPRHRLPWPTRETGRHAPYTSLHADENLTLEEWGELLKLLRDTIAADRFPLSQRIRNLKAALAKLDPAAAPAKAAEPFPAPVAWVNSTIGQRKRRGRR